MATHEYDKIVTIEGLATFKDEADALYSTIDGTVAGVQVNGTDLTPDANHRVNVTIAESTNNGKVKVNGADVAIHGLGTAAYEATTAFDAAGAAAAVLGQSTDGDTAKTVYGAIALANTKTANSPTTTTPKMDGTAAVGTETAYAKGDHVHPTDTSRAPVSHASSATTYGKGDGTNYGHVKLSDSTTGTETAAAGGTAATPKAVADVKAAIPSASTTSPSMDGTASYGSGTDYARANHVHPTDTSRAPLASPTFTGTPAAPTATAGTNTTQIATTAFVQTAIGNALAGNAAFQGEVDAQSTITNSNYKTGWYWIVTTAGTYVGQTCEVGDAIYAKADKGSSYSANDFFVVQTNVDMSLYVLKTDLTWASDADVSALFAS